MKIRVISEFYDKFHTGTLFKVGTVLDFEESRANDVIMRKLAEPYVEEPAKEKLEKPNVQKEPAKTEEAPVVNTEAAAPKKERKHRK